MGCLEACWGRLEVAVLPHRPGHSSLIGTALASFTLVAFLAWPAPGHRSVSSSVFNGAPRFHWAGSCGDEIPIIGKRGEGVFTKEQMANMAPVGGMGAGVAPVINIIAPGTVLEKPPPGRTPMAA